MNRTILVALAAALVMPMPTFADPNVYGFPDFSCQAPAGWMLHDYGAPATGSVVGLPYDGNFDPACPYQRLPLFNPNDEPCLTLWTTNSAAWHTACATNRPAPYDGDMEWLVGGANLASESGDLVTYGSLVCYGTEGHHAPGSVLRVDDATFDPVAFTVTADYTDPAHPVPPFEADCGDNAIRPCGGPPPPPPWMPPPVAEAVRAVNEAIHGLTNPGAGCTPGDVAKTCMTWDAGGPVAPPCLLDFPPGIDGAYVVFVGPSQAANNGLPTGASVGHVWTA